MLKQVRNCTFCYDNKEIDESFLEVHYLYDLHFCCILFLFILEHKSEFYLNLSILLMFHDFLSLPLLLKTPLALTTVWRGLRTGQTLLVAILISIPSWPFDFSSPGEVFLADMIDSDSWRLWPKGDKAQMKDKQVYRNMKEVNEEGLQQVKKNFEWIEDELKVTFEIMRKNVKFRFQSRTKRIVDLEFMRTFFDVLLIYLLKK